MKKHIYTIVLVCLMVLAVWLLGLMPAQAGNVNPSGPGGVTPASPCGDSSHALSWSGSAYGCQAITGTTTPGGSNGQIQYNNSGALGGVTAVPVANGGTGTASTLTGIVRGGSPMTGAELSGDATTSGSNAVTVTKINGTTPGGTCTNQAVTSVSSSAVPTCSTLTSSYVDTSIAKTGTDINTSNQVTSTHLSAGLPIAQGGTAATASGAVASSNISGGTAANSNLGTGTINGCLTASGTNTDTTPLACGNQKLTLTANDTLTIAEGTITNTPSATNIYTTQFEICQNGTGNFTLAFAAGTGITNFEWSGAGSTSATVGQPAYTLTASTGDWYQCLYDGTSLRCKETLSNVPC